MFKGKKLKLNKAKLYISSRATDHLYEISGTYYVYDNKEYNGKYLIVKRKRDVGKFPAIDYALGYILKEEVIC